MNLFVNLGVLKVLRLHYHGLCLLSYLLNEAVLLLDLAQPRFPHNEVLS